MDPITDTVGPAPVEYPSMLKLAAALRAAREFGNKAQVPGWVPLLGGTGAGDLVMGEAPEGAERIAYGNRLTKGSGETLQLRNEALDLGMLGAGSAGNATRLTKAAAPAVARGLRAAAENAAAPRSMARAGQRGAVLFEGQGQQELPGIEMSARERLEQARNDWYRARELPADTPGAAEAVAEASLRINAGHRAVRAETMAAKQAELQTLREGRTPGEALDPSYKREERILSLKEGADERPSIDELRQSRGLVRKLREAREQVNAPPPEVTPPQWVQRFNEAPTMQGARANGQPLPAGADWWNEQFNIDPDAPPASVAAFLKSVRDVPEAFQYGTMPQGAHSLEDFADEFGRRAGKRIHVEEGYGETDEPYKIETEKTHGRYELMRDRHGDYKYSENPKTHERGDSPMYDERGDVKKVELKGPTQDLEPLIVKRVAKGGEPMRDEYGNEKYAFKKSEGGEPMRDERGRKKYTKEENPDYREPERTELSTNDGSLSIEDYGGDARVHAMGAGDSGALLYQTLLAHASREGNRIGVDALTHDNQFRILSNALANYARTGVNPRNVSGTLSGDRPRARGFAPGERIWQAESGEADHRIARSRGDPNAVQFDGRTFTYAGMPIDPQRIAASIKEISPEVAHTKVGAKSVMRSAVFKWLEKATPEEADAAAKQWAKVGGPLFGAFGAAGLADAMRKDASPMQ